MLNIHSNFREETFMSVNLQSIAFSTTFLYIYKISSVSAFLQTFLSVQSSPLGVSYTFKVGCRIPFSMRWVFRVLYTFNCCSGWSTNSCCSTLLGFGPLITKQKRQSSCYFKRAKGNIYPQFKVNPAFKCRVAIFFFFFFNSNLYWMGNSSWSQLILMP